MKLQIEGQHLRVRIGEDELAQLLAGEPVRASTQFAQAFAMTCTLRLAAGSEARFAGQPGAWIIDMPEAAVREHTARLPTREGLTFILAGNDAGEALELLFDVDVRDSVRQRLSR
ncbi:hypothetical protein [Dyella silvae]|uniref:hypothetical protein n=1 Tax=Dyella silvae TaxID=2994424 RepID=UPI002263E641|nr:hypothetical protein [Dyella silvae]